MADVVLIQRDSLYRESQNIPKREQWWPQLREKVQGSDLQMAV